jgi:hypothetical protein
MPLHDLPDFQARFLQRFGINPGAANWRRIALNDAMTSSSRRTRLYEPPSDLRMRTMVREFWGARLEERLTAYEIGGAAFATEQQYQRDVLDLRLAMNQAFPGVFLVRQSGVFEPGFRVAHAQKSLSLVLKHGWCNGTVVMPPHCVVDRRVLATAGANQVLARWSDVNNWNAHLDKIAIIEAASLMHADRPLTLAEWELWAFEEW